MLFNSVEFIFLFFPIVFLAYVYLTKRQPGWAIAWLSLASLFFYSWWDISNLPILLISIAFNFYIGKSINERRGASKRQALNILRFGIVLNLLALGYYKYAHFLVNEGFRLFDVALSVPHIELPIGISFFTFTQIAFLVDTYRGEVDECNPVHYSLFVGYFPHLIAGPILHHKEMMPQFKNVVIPSVFSDDFRNGMSIFLIGLAKKLLIADSLGNYANYFFNGVASGGTPTFFDSATGVLAYTFQLYFDFSGYSDMAVGISLMLGIRLPINFNSPYKAKNVIDFWRRWHITLSRFLRDYLYIALGGNRKGATRRYLNLFITMLLGGLWHGAGWTFLLWGAMHGAFLGINHFWRHLTGRFATLGKASAAISWIYVPLTFISVVLAWIAFRAASIADFYSVLRGVCGLNGFTLPSQILAMVPKASSWIEGRGVVPLLADGTVMGFVELIILLLIVSCVTWCFKNSNEMSTNRRLLVAVMLAPLLIQKIFFGGDVEFLYFQF